MAFVYIPQGANTTESYTYDPVGNRLSSLGVSPYVDNTSNELTSTPNASYTYDYNGNTTSKTVSSGTTNYTWDYENRLASATLPGTGGSITFKYDPLGRRIQKAFTQNSTTTTTNYLYDGSNAIADIDQNANVLARYAETQNIDEPLAELRSGTTSYYEADGLGSITSLTNGTGAIANTYTYDSFGNQTASSGSITNRFQYTAREFDSESGLYYYRARYYDSSAGRFMSEDPVGFSVGPDFYTYVLNNPTNDLDPPGLWPDPYKLWKAGRKAARQSSCWINFYACGFHLGDDRKALDSMSDDDIMNTAAGQGNQGGLSNQSLKTCLAADQNCKAALEQCLKLALTNPFPPPWWLDELIRYFSTNSPTPTPPVKRE
ncbi:MAG: RHS repeat domain-containing protein [Candidatus Acidiferrales bacterium]